MSAQEEHRLRQQREAEAEADAAKQQERLRLQSLCERFQARKAVTRSSICSFSTPKHD